MIQLKLLRLAPHWVQSIFILTLYVQLNSRHVSKGCSLESIAIAIGSSLEGDLILCYPG